MRPVISTIIIIIIIIINYPATSSPSTTVFLFRSSQVQKRTERSNLVGSLSRYYHETLQVCHVENDRVPSIMPFILVGWSLIVVSVVTVSRVIYTAEMKIEFQINRFPLVFGVAHHFIRPPSSYRWCLPSSGA